MTSINFFEKIKEMKSDDYVFDREAYKKEYLRREVEQANNLSNLLQDGYNCNSCKNRGWTAEIMNDAIVYRECNCMKTRNSISRANRSGLSKILKKCTLNKYIAENEWQLFMKNKALDFINNANDNWFFAGGQSGCGKTHICTGICRELLLKGTDILYVQWLEYAPKLKTLGEETEILIQKLKNIELLYIDDFWKSERNAVPTAADIKLAMDILNYRYINNLTTIVSTEYTMGEIVNIDAAVGGRIAEKCYDYMINIGLDNKKNFRLKKFNVI